MPLCSLGYIVRPGLKQQLLIFFPYGILGKDFIVGPQTAQILDEGGKRDGKEIELLFCCVLKVTGFPHHRPKEVRVF